MQSHKKSVALVTSSPALGSIIAMLLENEPFLRVQQFDGFKPLVKHMRLLPVDMIVSDFDLDAQELPELVACLRRTLPQRRYQLIALTSHISREIKLSCRFAGVDEVIIKPMSPLFLKERIFSRLGIDTPQDSDFSTGISSPSGNADTHVQRLNNAASNVIPLFGYRKNTPSGDALRPV